MGIASGPRGSHGRRKILMDSHPYSHETSIFILGAPHEEVQGRQTKLHPGFTMGKLQSVHGRGWSKMKVSFFGFQSVNFQAIVTKFYNHYYLAI